MSRLPFSTCAAAAVLTLFAVGPNAPARADAGNSGKEGYARFGSGSIPPPLAPETNYPLPGKKFITRMIFPLVGNVRSYHDGYNVSRGTYRHTGIDIPANKMRPIVAPFSGVIGFKTQTFWIYGDTGFKCLGTHLNDDTPGTNDNTAQRDFMFVPNIRTGDRVFAGQLIGFVGDSGKATGPHLHFELFAPDGMLIDPIYSLHAATHIGAPRPVVSDPGTRPAQGEVRVEGCIRGWNPDHRVLTLLLTTRENPRGQAFAVTFPTYYRLSLPAGVSEPGGEGGLFTSLSRDRAVAFDVVEGHSGVAKVRGAVTAGLARRVVFPVAEREQTIVAAHGRNALVTANAEDVDINFADFEKGTFAGWTLTGDCWTSEPAGDDTYEGAIRGFQGQRFLNTFHPKLGVAATGAASSREFTIEKPFINFLIGGGNLPGQVCMNLVVDGRVVRTQTGNNRRTLEQASWNVRSYIGRQARLVIVDQTAEPEVGYIMVDAITFSSQPNTEKYGPALGSHRDIQSAHAR